MEQLETQIKKLTDEKEEERKRLNALEDRMAERKTLETRTMFQVLVQIIGTRLYHTQQTVLTSDQILSTKIYDLFVQSRVPIFEVERWIETFILKLPAASSMVALPTATPKHKKRRSKKRIHIRTTSIDSNVST